MINNALVYTSE